MIVELRLSRGVNNLGSSTCRRVARLCSACLVEALASYQYDDGDAVRLQSSKTTDRIISTKVSGQFGALALVFSLCAGFGLDLAHMSPYHPLAWVARVNPLRWFVEGVVLRSARRPRFKRHRAPSPARGGFSRSSSEMCVRSLVVLIVCFRLISYCFLARAPEEPISVDPRKLRGRCGEEEEEEEEEEDAEGIITIPPSTTTCATSRLRMRILLPSYRASLQNQERRVRVDRRRRRGGDASFTKGLGSAFW